MHGWLDHLCFEDKFKMVEDIAENASQKQHWSINLNVNVFELANKLPCAYRSLLNPLNSDKKLRFMKKSNAEIKIMLILHTNP